MGEDIPAEEVVTGHPVPLFQKRRAIEGERTSSPGLSRKWVRSIQS